MFPSSRAFRSCAALLMLAASIASCGKKSIVPPGDGVDGIASSSQLVVYPDLPVRVYVMDDGVNPTCSDDDTLVAFQDIYATGPGIVNGTIFDYTDASHFQVLREDGATFRPLKDFTLEPTRRYFDGHVDVFNFTDRPAVPNQSYIGRGVVEGRIGATSPKTNVGRVTTGVERTLAFIPPTNICGDLPPIGEPRPDSLLNLVWSDVPGAVGYWVQVYQFGGGNFLSNVFPTPVFTGQSVDYFLGYFPAPITSYKIGDPLPAGARLLRARSLINNADYAVRISAVDANGQLISYTGDTRAWIIVRLTSPETQYLAIRLAAYIVHPGLSSLCSPGCPTSVATGLPSVRIFRTDALPVPLR